MNILVFSKVSIPEIDRTIPVWPDDIEVTDDLATVTETPDVIIGMGVGVMQQTEEAFNRFPEVKLFCYNWDCYGWAQTNPRADEYDYKRYGRLLAKATEVWVPSIGTVRRTRQWWDLPSRVIQSCCPYWDYPNIQDKGYVLCALRKIPDANWDWFERACEELNLPYRMSNHEETYEDYQELVAHCRFIVSHLYEASTGGLSLLEAYYLGKPVLINCSLLNGAYEYFSGRGSYFYRYPNLKAQLQLMFNHPPEVIDDHREWVSGEFSDKRMVSDIMERVNAHA